jgi:ABC-type spermidine/putrescine transport system permease subunit I
MQKVHLGTSPRGAEVGLSIHHLATIVPSVQTAVLAGFVALWTINVVIPLIFAAAFSFLQSKGLSVVVRPTLLAYDQLFSHLGGDVIARTVRVAATVTAIELLLAFPFALWLAKIAKSPVLKLATFLLLIVPFFMSPIARVFVWRAVLATDGIVNAALINAGITEQPVEWLLFSEFTVHFGLIGPYFPNMVWPLFLSISLIDDEYLEASKDLGGNFFQTFTLVILPLSMPGIVAGIVFTFIPMLGDAVVPQALGGNNVNLLSKSVMSMIGALNYTGAAAMAALVFVVIAMLQGLLWLAIRPLGGLNQVFAALQR